MATPMRSLTAFTIATVISVASIPVPAWEGEYRSRDTRPVVIELFTSEGCSSCPPAEKWLNQLRNSDQLWRSLFPMAFHVDYWDRLGWPDRFANPANSARQRRYKNQTSLSAVYTPGMMVNGEAWRGWVSRSQPATPTKKAIGALKATLSNNTYKARFDPLDDTLDTAAATVFIRTANSQPLILHIALLGFELTNKVQRGENAGRELRHNFVVLAHDSNNADTKPKNANETGSNVWKGQLPALPETASGARDLAIVFWLEDPSSPTPLQATGGWLNN